jgi:hypothetical protein
MKSPVSSTLLVLLLAASSGCTAAVGTAGMTSVPRDAASTCATHCSSIGMSLDSVVIMANNVGCVCRGGRSAAASDGATTAGGMAALIVAEQQRQQQQQQTQSSSR